MEFTLEEFLKTAIRITGILGEIHAANVIHKDINPSNIEETIEKYLQNPSQLTRKSQAALEYVHKWHDPVYIASITKSVYES